MDDQAEEDTGNSYQEEEIDFRSLLSHSRYDQIERELLRMFEQRRRDYHRQGLHCVHNHHHSLERHLLDIEEDLHKILLLMIKQLEMVSEKRETKPLAGSEPRRPQNPVFQPSRMVITTPVTSTTTGKPDRSTSEYSRLCTESDERFHKNLSKIQNSGLQATAKPLPDIDFIHSSTAANGGAKLKQHGPLCSRIGEFRQRIQHQNGASDHRPKPQVLRQIQGLIEELHMEHDWISKKLHHYQKQNEIILGQNKVLSQLADKINYRNMTTLSEHLIHIMDHLYELHQLNKHHLKSIIEN